ncbi:hypothetical protein [Chitinophaga sp. Cy-1792]|uniref:hypothetical protein n=1 Tax=Chitinophaga sp. Cy-1792 TaxID=2608339 RepID=UPI0014249A08|nr:hypothetical protein [Chitinophaga sp. Cy-1792]NIG52751.1 hypothetical protein [Chitinophaga sp. Cy-1792]
MRFKLWLTAILAVGLFITGCESKKDVSPKSFFTFKIGDSIYQSSSTEASLGVDKETGKPILTIDGVTNNFRQHMDLQIIFADSAVAGKYTTDIFVTLSDINTGTVSYYNVGTGVTINLTSINSKHAEGTFFGNLTSGEIEKPLTDGTFQVNY